MKTDKVSPFTYKGFLIDELLEFWKGVHSGEIVEAVPREKMLAMLDFLREYRLGLFGDPPPKKLSENPPRDLRKDRAPQGHRLH